MTLRAALILFFTFILFIIAAMAEEPGTVFEAIRIDSTLQLSGQLKDPAWQKARPVWLVYEFDPDTKSTTVSWAAFAKNFEFWMDPRFKATYFEVRELHITMARTGQVAWFSAILDDLGEWEGRPVGWRDTRWTGVLEKRDGKWVVVQMHFSYDADKLKAVR